MTNINRRSGIDIVGNVPWGTHFCQFYQTGEDLIDILVPYLKAGLENNEFCMWVTSEPLSTEEAKVALRKEVNNLDDYIQNGRIEFLSHDEWYLKDGAFDLSRVLDAWVDSLNRASTKGFEGIRVTSNAAWLDGNNWRSFAEYEERINRVIANYRMIALCTYSLTTCGAPEVIDVVSNHHFALIKREGKWVAIESAGQARVAEQLRESEEPRWSTLDSLVEGCQIIGYDWRYLHVNDAVVRRGHTTREQLLGKTIMECYPGIENTEVFAVLRCCMQERVARRVEIEFSFPDGSEGWFDLSIQPTSEGIVVLSVEITERKQAEEALRQSEENFRRSVDDSPLGIRIVTADSKTIYANRMLLDIYDCQSIDDFKATPMRERYTPESYAGFQERQEKRKRGDYVSPNYEIGIVRRDGETRYLSASRGEVIWNGEKQFQVFYQDITERKRSEEALKLSEANFRGSFDDSPLGIQIVTAEGETLYVNKALLDIFGYGSIEELRGTPVSQQYTAGAYLKQGVRRERPKRGLLVPDEHEISIVRKDGEVGYLRRYRREVTWAGRTECQVTYEDITSEKRVREALTALSRRLIEIQEEERHIIARELHDQIGQSMNVVNLLLQRAAKLAKPDIVSLINDAQAQTAELIRRVTNLSFEMRPAILDDLGLLDALIWYFGHYRTSTGVNVDFKHLGLGYPLGTHVTTTLYRVVQEALTNVARHADVDTATVRVWTDQHRVHLDVEDSGSGFNPTDLSPDASTGIIGMRERVILAGGIFMIESSPGLGTRITVEIPLGESAAVSREVNDHHFAG